MSEEDMKDKLIADLRAEISLLQGELAKVNEFITSKLAVIRADVKSAFHRMGFNHVDATKQVNQILGPE